MNKENTMNLEKIQNSKISLDIEVVYKKLCRDGRERSRYMNCVIISPTTNEPYLINSLQDILNILNYHKFITILSDNRVEIINTGYILGLNIKEDEA
jgi:hypothetical protein